MFGKNCEKMFESTLHFKIFITFVPKYHNYKRNLLYLIFLRNTSNLLTLTVTVLGMYMLGANLVLLPDKNMVQQLLDE